MDDQVEEKGSNKYINKAGRFLSSRGFIKILAVGIGGYVLYKTFTGASKGFAAEPVNNVDLIVEPNYPQTTITASQAKIHAQTLLEAMDVQPYGTDDDRILAVFKNINAQDFKMIFNAFGMKNYNGYGSPPESWIWQQIDNFQERNLVYWLKSELSDSKKKEVYTLVKEIVEEAGFTF